MNPAIVVSLDVELRWGLVGLLGNDVREYAANLEGETEAVLRLLEAFAPRGVRATWAVVGALACRDWDEWHARAPAYPQYHDPIFRWPHDMPRRDPLGKLHFARGLVDAILGARGQELASHTFGHVFFREPGFTRQDAIDDTDAVRRLFEEGWGYRLRSVVFPRNQVAFTDVLQESGIVCWRSNPTPFYWNAATESERTAIARGLRFADAMARLGRRAAPAAAQRSSFFVRLTLPPALWRLHRRRIAAEARGLREGDALHLWFHPHNIGLHPAAGVARMAELLDAVRDAAPRSTCFMSMGDVATAGADAERPAASIASETPATVRDTIC